MNSHQIDNVTDPTSAQDASTKKYVDDRIAILKGTHYWSRPGCALLPISPATDDIYVDADNGSMTVLSGSVFFSCPVYLPHGAVVTGVIVYASGTNVTWRLFRDTHSRSGSPGTMATASTNTEDTSISNATINNLTHSYWFEIGATTSATYIDSIRITYTL